MDNWSKRGDLGELYFIMTRFRVFLRIFYTNICSIRIIFLFLHLIQGRKISKIYNEKRFASVKLQISRFQRYV